MTARRVLSATVLALLAVLVLPAAAASAHTVLVSSEPAAGTTLAESPGIARLTFSLAVDAARSSVRLVDGTGTEVPGTSVVPAPDARVLALALPRLRPGSYGLVWEAVAARDEHLSAGTVVFGIGAPSAAGALPSSGAGAFDVLRRWAGLAALALITGPLAVALLVLGGPAQSARMTSIAPALAVARRRLFGLAVIGSTVAIAVAIADLVAELVRRPAVGNTVVVALGTGWGRLWVTHTAALLLLVVVLRYVRTTSPPRRAPTADERFAVPGERPARSPSRVAVGCAVLSIVMLMAVLIAVEALGSHAAAVESGRGVALVSAGVHAWSGLLWLGAVPALLVTLWPRALRTEVIRAVRGRFAALAGASVTTVLVTGLHGAGAEVASVDDLTGTSYGRLLLVKTALLAGMGALGLGAAVRLHDRRPAVSRLMVVEVGVGAALLLTVGVLAGQSPPAPSAGGAGTETGDAAGVGRTGAAAAGDLQVTVSATPNRPGLNWFTVIAESTRRPAPYPVGDVALRIGDSHGTTVVRLRPLVAGRYVGTYQAPAAGPLSVVAVVDRGGGLTQQLRIGWRIGTSAAPVTVSPGHGLAPYADAAALVLVLEGVVVAGAWRLLRRRRAAVPIAVPDEPKADGPAGPVPDELASGGMR